jgi:putative addiction module component (TIGR02574 family)
MPTAKQLCDQASQPPPEERMALVDQILDTLDERDESLDAQWAQEAESRLAAYRRGEVQAIPLNEVIAKYQVKTVWKVKIFGGYYNLRIIITNGRNTKTAREFIYNP